jgi:hypothetical protein
VGSPRYVVVRRALVDDDRVGLVDLRGRLGRGRPPNRDAPGVDQLPRVLARTGKLATHEFGVEPAAGHRPSGGHVEIGQRGP